MCVCVCLPCSRTRICCNCHIGWPLGKYVLCRAVTVSMAHTRIYLSTIFYLCIVHVLKGISHLSFRAREFPIWVSSFWAKKHANKNFTPWTRHLGNTRERRDKASRDGQPVTDAKVAKTKCHKGWYYRHMGWAWLGTTHGEDTRHYDSMRCLSMKEMKEHRERGQLF